MARVGDPGLFNGYYEPYFQKVWAFYSSSDASLSINTETGFGVTTGAVKDGQLTFGSNVAFGPPSTGDIFSCFTGPFATGSDAERNAIIPRLAAAFNRSALLNSRIQASDPSTYYQDQITNHVSLLPPSQIPAFCSFSSGPPNR